MNNLKLAAILLLTATAATPKAETWGHIVGSLHGMTNDSLYVDRQSKDFTRFSFDLELNTRVAATNWIITVGAEGAGKPQPGFTRVAGRLTLTYELAPGFSVFGHHRSAHNLDTYTSSPKYGFENDNQVGFKLRFGHEGR